MSFLNKLADNHCEAISQELRRRRLAAKMSVNKLSDLSGVTRGMINFVEKGERVPTVRILFLLARGLGISPTEILEAAERAGGLGDL